MVKAKKTSSVPAPKIAIVHDWLYGGGAELVVLELHKLYPQAPIYTSYCTDEWRKKLDNKVITGYLQNWPFNKLRKFLPLLRQRWFRNLDLRKFDIVISSSGNGEAKFIRVTESAKHICYCHTPTHFYWRKYQQYLENPGFKPEWLVRFGLKLLVRPLRKRDYAAAQRVDIFIANSSHIQNDIKKYYDRDSVVIHPPVDVDRFNVKRQTANSKPKPRSGFVTWGRHVHYKRFDLAVKACNQLKKDLIVIGDGPETKKLKNLAGPRVQFPGRVSDEELVEIAKNSEAFLFPGEEDFGISPVEALAAGLPVIAYKSGGALDYIEPGKTGEFFPRQNAHSLAKAITNFHAKKYNNHVLAKHANQFSAANFQTKVKDLMESI